MNKFEEIINKINCGEIYFFHNVDLEKSGITNLTRKELLDLIAHLNKIMIESTESWDGG